MTFSEIRRTGGLLPPALLILLAAGCSAPPDRLTGVKSVQRLPRITPDYTGVVIPPEIAPLNFSVDEPGRGVFVVIRAPSGDPVRLKSRSSSVRIPNRAWKRLLRNARGGILATEVYVRDESGAWSRFRTIENSVSADSIDSFLTYRRLGALYNLWTDMGIYQRDLRSFDEKVILDSRMTGDACMNCHTPWRNGSDRWLLHLRNGPGTSMLLTVDGKTRRIDTRSGLNKGPAAYSAWHPAGDRIAFSVSKLLLFFHATGENRDVLDRSSDILLYDIRTNTVSTSAGLASPNRMEIWPAWAPDGRSLYFCSAPPLESFVLPAGTGDPFAYDRIRYDLMRISYDPASGAWGKPETVLSADRSGLSFLEPRVSPDGRFVLVTVSPYSQFPIYLQGSDLAIVDAATGRWRLLSAANSERADTYHSWSSNGRWFVFSSKRRDGLFARPYLCHVDAGGRESKPFVLPQKDPLFYRTFLQNYNAPELVREAVTVSPRALAAAAFDDGSAMAAEPKPGDAKR
jgi:hypothetical protein